MTGDRERLADRQLGSAAFPVAVTASAGLTVAFAVSGGCTVAGTTVTLTVVGTCTLTAAQAGDANHSAATAVARSFQVTAAPPAQVALTLSVTAGRTVLVAPPGTVSGGGTVVFITRAMIAKGYWVAQPGAVQPYAGAPAVFATEVATYNFYTQGAGGLPAPPSNWNDGATRGWFARALWVALDTYWGTDGTLPDDRNGGGYQP